ncbi:MAG: MotA/TolQ/ExbB proton channel family protein [Lachnospiraceae bacterium]|nr:MotA/TolQ/ExbB proton channel family protein [Lachnospiraceae bacterium]
MQNRKWYDWLLALTFVAMVVVCILLTVFSAESLKISSILVNGAMFVIVALILVACDRNCFQPVDEMVAELNEVTAKIRKDAMNSHDFLWNQYQQAKTPLFKQEVLVEQYHDFLMELGRIERAKGNADNAYYKCDVEEYINYELMDSVIHRNQLNQVAGVMTGLGILGTFIGLSIGLQSFSTGTTAEITNSIEPLMNGIKVAFHTSIYGMVFSLVFNFVYKKKLDEAETAVKNFLTAYKKYVLPDTATDGINKLMELQEKQTEAIRSLATTVGRDLSEGLSELLSPQFDRFDQTLASFGNMATRNQLDALSVVVNAFIAEMNKSLSNRFSQLAYTIDQIYLTQEKGTKQMTEAMQLLQSAQGETEERIQQMQTESERRMQAAQADLVRELQASQQEIAGAAADLRQQASAGLALARKEQDQYESLLDAQAAVEKTAFMLNTQVQNQEAILAEMQRLTSQLPNDVDHTFRVIDDNLIEVETHFRDTILDIKSATDQIPGTIAAAYERMEDTVRQLGEAVDDLADVSGRLMAQMDMMQRRR